MSKIRQSSLYLASIGIFALVIAINFKKPFGFFRDSNPAMVCINTDLWRQYPALREEHIPMLSYDYDPRADPQTQLYNSVLSFGYGWFLVPHCFFTLFTLPANEITIRVFSLLWLGLTLFSAWLLLRELTKSTPQKSPLIFLALLFYVFNAGVLWYQVNGYVHEIAVLPFYLLSWWIFARLLAGYSLAKPSPGLLVALWVLLFAGIQFDWLPFFQACTMSAWLFLFRKRAGHRAAFLVPLTAVLAGIAYIIYHYSQWTGFAAYMDFLKGKFLGRTLGAGGLKTFPWLNYNFNIILFYIMGYGLLSLLFVYGIIKRQVLAPVTSRPLIGLMIASALLHHFLFWGFSTEHDYAVIKMAFPIAFVSALMLQSMPMRRKMLATGGILLTNIFLYFFLHNIYRRGGMYENPDFCYQAGTFIHAHLPLKEERVFLDTEGKYLTQIEYYAKKPYYMAHSVEEAKALFRQAQLTGQLTGTGWFLSTKNGEIVRLTELK